MHSYQRVDPLERATFTENLRKEWSDLAQLDAVSSFPALAEQPIANARTLRGLLMRVMSVNSAWMDLGRISETHSVFEDAQKKVDVSFSPPETSLYALITWSTDADLARFLPIYDKVVKSLVAQRSHELTGFKREFADSARSLCSSGAWPLPPERLERRLKEVQTFMADPIPWGHASGFYFEVLDQVVVPPFGKLQHRREVHDHEFVHAIAGNILWKRERPLMLLAGFNPAEFWSPSNGENASAPPLQWCRELLDLSVKNFSGIRFGKDRNSFITEGIVRSLTRQVCNECAPPAYSERIFDLLCSYDPELRKLFLRAYFNESLATTPRENRIKPFRDLSAALNAKFGDKFLPRLDQKVKETFKTELMQDFMEHIEAWIAQCHALK